MHPAYSFDPEDERLLVGASTDVFVGSVKEQVGEKPLPVSGNEPDNPRPQFAGEVQEGIKGGVADTVTMNQIGGYLKDGQKEHKHLILDEGDELLKPGQECLFATHFNEQEGWYQVMSQPYGAVEIGDQQDREEVEQAEAGEIDPENDEKK